MPANIGDKNHDNTIAETPIHYIHIYNTNGYIYNTDRIANFMYHIDMHN